MSTKICFIHTETNGLHKTNENISKKNLYNFARLVILNYEIGYIENNEYCIEKTERIIIKPNCMYINEDTIKYHGINQEFALENGTDPSDVIQKFKEDIKNINIIISHNIDFHLRTILAEAVRYNIQINLINYIIIDTISFFHDYGFIKMIDLAEKLIIKNITEKNNIELIRDIFFRLYYKFEKHIKNLKKTK